MNQTPLPADAGPACAPRGLDSAPAGRPARILGLDALRGLAALSVLLGHYTLSYDHLYGHTDQVWLRYPWARHGVLLFFMISGFVILMTAERVASAADFAWARFRRLYPAYWASVAVTFTVLLLFPLPGRQPTTREALVNLTMVQNVLGARNVDGVYWTLHVELYFYAIVFVMLCAGRLRHVEFVLLGLVALGTLDGLLLHDVKSAWLTRLRHVLILDNAFAFLIGVSLYRACKSPRWWHAGLVAAGLAYALLYGRRGEFVAAVVCVALLWVAVRGWLPVLEWRGLVFLGTISYPLYLTHQNIGYVIIRSAEGAGLDSHLAIALAASAALLLACAITFAVERPAMVLLRRRPRPHMPAVPAPAPLPGATA